MNILVENGENKENLKTVKSEIIKIKAMQQLKIIITGMFRVWSLSMRGREGCEFIVHILCREKYTVYKIVLIFLNY